MRYAGCFLASLAAASLASCGGGSDGSESIPTVFLPITLVSSGEVATAAPPAISQVVVVSSADQLTQLASGRFDIPPALATFDFALGDIAYVEGVGDSDPTSVARIGQISRSTNAEFVQAEICSSGPRVPGNHRPYALYTTPNIVNLDSFAVVLGTYDCPSVRRIAATFVSAGSYLNLNHPPPPPRVIRTQADFEMARVAGVIPASYPMPDFTQTNLVYFNESGSHVGPYLRLMVLVQEVDGSRTAVVEHCDVITNTSHIPVVVHSVYSMPAFSGAVQEVIIARRVTLGGETCVTTP